MNKAVQILDGIWLGKLVVRHKEDYFPKALLHRSKLLLSGQDDGPKAKWRNEWG